MQFTWCIPHMFCISESDGHSNAENHKYPVDLWDVDLAMYFIRGMNNLDSWEASKWLALVDYRECSADDRLTSHNRGKNRNYKHWPPHSFCTKKTLQVIIVASTISSQCFRNINRVTNISWWFKYYNFPPQLTWTWIGWNRKIIVKCQTIQFIRQVPIHFYMTNYAMYWKQCSMKNTALTFEATMDACTSFNFQIPNLQILILDNSDIIYSSALNA